SWLYESLIAWFKNNGRALPWRKTRDPYKILISEIMLQQTNVDIVIPIYRRFIKEFPTIRTLALSQLSEVKIITDNLGYKRRGEYLYEIAKQIVFDKDGVFPSTLEDLLSLKGIGRYTAGAILSFAYEKQDKTSAIVDVNVERVLSRIFGLHNEPKNSKFDSKIWNLSEKLVLLGNVWFINQSILDLGAMVCISQKPKCPICPMVEFCEYYILEVPKVIPLDSFF
ncbi:MAG: A/G-specific adenine glycosylase, partial [Promethearchaeota archaeon]